MSALEELVDSLLWEGYALYPYTPGATKNATPTPFGIVYPPRYAEDNPGAFDRLRLEVVLDGPGPVWGEIRFLQATGERHEARERRVALPAPGGFAISFPPLQARARLRSEALEDGRVRVVCCLHNETPFAGGGRVEALERSFVSTHVVLRAAAGRFISPLESGGEHVNCFPVLATAEDDAVVAAAIVLPDHPQIAPESRGSLFDGTEIEEALLLHVQALSDGEREEIAAHDPAVREMVERAATTTPEDLMRLHGRLELRDPRAGEPEATVDGLTFRRGTRVLLRPGRDGDPYDRMLHGRPATVERIYCDDEERVHLAVSIDDDPGRDLMRDTGRYHFFKPEEVELR
jgi:hypothetical protein